MVDQCKDTVIIVYLRKNTNKLIHFKKYYMINSTHCYIRSKKKEAQSANIDLSLNVILLLFKHNTDRKLRIIEIKVIDDQ